MGVQPPLEFGAEAFENVHGAFVVLGIVGRTGAAPRRRRSVSERRTERAAAHGQHQRPDPPVEGLAELVHRELLDAQHHHGVHVTESARRDAAAADGPA